MNKIQIQIEVGFIQYEKLGPFSWFFRFDRDDSDVIEICGKGLDKAFEIVCRTKFGEYSKREWIRFYRNFAESILQYKFIQDYHMFDWYLQSDDNFLYTKEMRKMFSLLIDYN